MVEKSKNYESPALRALPFCMNKFVCNSPLSTDEDPYSVTEDYQDGEYSDIME